MPGILHVVPHIWSGCINRVLSNSSRHRYLISKPADFNLNPHGLAGTDLGSDPLRQTNTPTVPDDGSPWPNWRYPNEGCCPYCDPCKTAETFELAWEWGNKKWTQDNLCIPYFTMTWMFMIVLFVCFLFIVFRLISKYAMRSRYIFYHWVCCSYFRCAITDLEHFRGSMPQSHNSDESTPIM